MALPAHLFKEITPASPIHTIPHRTTPILLGLVNIRGDLQLCVSLTQLLTLAAAQPTTAAAKLGANHPLPDRMMVMERAGDRWVFPVDEIYGVERFPLSALKPTPTNVANSTHTHTKGLIAWRGTHVGVLDEELLFYTLVHRGVQA